MHGAGDVALDNCGRASDIPFRSDPEAGLTPVVSLLPVVVSTRSMGGRDERLERDLLVQRGYYSSPFGTLTMVGHSLGMLKLYV